MVNKSLQPIQLALVLLTGHVPSQERRSMGRVKTHQPLPRALWMAMRVQAGRASLCIPSR